MDVKNFENCVIKMDSIIKEIKAWQYENTMVFYKALTNYKENLQDKDKEIEKLKNLLYDRDKEILRLHSIIEELTLEIDDSEEFIYQLLKIFDDIKEEITNKYITENHYASEVAKLYMHNVANGCLRIIEEHIGECGTNTKK